MAAVTAMRLTTIVIRVRMMLTRIKVFDVEGSDDDSSDSSRSLVDARMVERKTKIHKRKMK